MPKTKKATKTTPVKATSKTAKSTKKAEPKVKLSIKATSDKKDKKSEKLEVKAVIAGEGQTNEEEEDEMETSGSSSGSNAGLAIAAAAATADTTTGSLKNFRHHPDIENFYRFIYENDLRYEALEIIDLMASQRATKKAVKVAKSKAH